MSRLATVALFVLGVAAMASAQNRPVPEVDPSAGINALTLLAGAAMVVRAAIKK